MICTIFYSILCLYSDPKLKINQNISLSAIAVLISWDMIVCKRSHFGHDYVERETTVIAEL